MLKSRGSAALSGYHDFDITEDGVAVYPRIEMAYASPTRRDAPEPMPVHLGVDGLDALIGGGLPSRSVTLLLGPSGAGKTSFGLSFLSAASAECARALFRLLRNARAASAESPFPRLSRSILWLRQALSKSCGGR